MATHPPPRAARDPSGTGLRLAALALIALAVSACATGPDRAVLDHPTVPLDRPNGQPRWLPCMGGDALCTPP